MTNARTAKSAREKAAALRAEAERAEARRKTMVVTGAVAALIAILVAGVVLIKTAADDRRARETAAAAPPANLVEGGILVGNTGAKVTIELYEDFLCPACKSFEDTNTTQLNAWVKAGTVKLVHRPVSILDRLSADEYSTRSANAAAAVVNSSPSAFPAFHKALFANQPAEGGAGLPDAKLVELAVAAGADKAQIESAITERKYKTWVANSTEDFSKKGFTGTPTVVVAGKKLDDVSPAAVKTAVEAAAKG
jgi:protein-disulfide isomerase